jgi:glycine/D-amino acid oxidase-like deaminating enzyme
MAQPRLNREFERRPYWHAMMPSLPDRSGRQLPDVADAVVVGGGYTGVAAARKLALQGARTVLLEAHELGWGASSRNGGIVHAGYKWGLPTLIRRHGRELGTALFRETTEGIEFLAGLIRENEIDAELRRTGHLEVAWGPSHAERFAEEARALADAGVNARAVARADLAAELGTPLYHGALAIDGGGVVHPGKWFAGLVRLAERAGAELHEGVRVRAIRRQPDGRFVVETERGALLARDVLVATNGYTDGAAPAVRRRIVPVGSYIIATEPLPEDLANSITPTGRAVFDTKNFLNYWHVAADRRLIFGGRVSFIPTTVGRTAQLLYRRLHEIHPQVGDVRVEYAWGGKVALTFDRMPHVGRLGGVAFAGAYCGSGVALSAYLGTQVAEWMGGGAAPALARLRFPIVPAPYEGRPWFLPVVGEWYRLRDRMAARSRPDGG